MHDAWAYRLQTSTQLDLHASSHRRLTSLCTQSRSVFVSSFRDNGATLDVWNESLRSSEDNRVGRVFGQVRDSLFGVSQWGGSSEDAQTERITFGTWSSSTSASSLESVHSAHWLSFW